MSVSATLTWKGLNKTAIMAQLEVGQTQALRQAKPIIERVIKATVGTRYFSKWQLEKMGHPYRIGGTPPMPPGVINAQSKRFYKAMQINGPTKIKGLLVIQIYNLDEDRAWQLGGTEKEIPRPYKALLQARLRQQTARQLAPALRAALKIKVSA